MESSLRLKNLQKKRRSWRVRKKLRGSATAPSLCVVKTNKHIYVQLIDDEQGRTLASVSTIARAMRDQNCVTKNKDSARKLGLQIAEQSKELQVSRAIFDRGPSKYHGIIAMVAEGAREGGLQF